MTTPSNAEKNIRLARFVYPDGQWIARPDGDAFAPYIGPFNVADRKDRQDVIMKLQLNHSITIHERKRSGRTVWEAVTRDGGSTEHESLEILLWQVVEGLTNG